MGTPKFISRLLNCTALFRKDKKGQVALMMGFAFIPLMGFVGAAVDYSRGSNSLAQLNAAADAVALNAVTAARNSSNHTMPGNTALRAFFDAATGTPAGITISNFTIVCVSSAGVTQDCSSNATGINVKVSYTAALDTVFMRALGVNTMALSGSATASTSYPSYIDFFLLLDNSPSMGLAGSAADITALQNATPDACAFACHQKNSDGSEQDGHRISSNNYSRTDYYHIAKATSVTTGGVTRPVKLRIDFLREAVQNLMDTAQRSETAVNITNLYRAAIYTFSDSVQTISALNTNLATQKTAAAAIDLAYSRFDQSDAQTSFDRAIPVMNSTVIANGGDGSSASVPQKFLFIVTDGVQDQFDPNVTCVDSSNATTQNTNCTGNSGARQINLINHDDSGNVNGPPICRNLKNAPRNVKIAILYTPYLEPDNQFYRDYVLPLDTTAHTGIADSLRKCASPGFFFTIDSTGNINSAMQAMFASAVKYSQLTK